MKSNLLIVEPSDIIREGLKAILEDDFNILAPLRDALDLPLRLPVIQPDVLLINPTLLSSHAWMDISNYSQLRPSMAVVGLVYQYVAPETLQAFKTVLDIREPQNRVVQVLRDSLAGMGEGAAAEEESYELSDREKEVLVLVAQGCSSKEIADRLFISIHTVNTHRKNLTRKTGIKSVAGLAVYAMLHNLV